MKKAGEPVTMAAIRGVLGRGSYSTIVALYKELVGETGGSPSGSRQNAAKARREALEAELGNMRRALRDSLELNARLEGRIDILREDAKMSQRLQAKVDALEFRLAEVTAERDARIKALEARLDADKERNSSSRRKADERRRSRRP